LEGSCGLLVENVLNNLRPVIQEEYRVLLDKTNARNIGIIFVGDEIAIVGILSEVLQVIFSRSTVMIYSTMDGHKALRILEQKQHQIDLIITDVNHPGLSGIEICKIAREKYQGIKTFIMTGYTKSADQARSEKASDIVFQKPFKLEEFEKAMKDLLPNY